MKHSLRIVGGSNNVPEPGWLYILTSDIAPGWVLVGGSTDPVDEAMAGVAAQLPVHTAAMSRVPDLRAAKAVVQRALQPWQHPKGGSWYQLPTEKAAGIIAAVLRGRISRRRGQRDSPWSQRWKDGLFICLTIIFYLAFFS